MISLNRIPAVGKSGTSRTAARTCVVISSSEIMSNGPLVRCEFPVSGRVSTLAVPALSAFDCEGVRQVGQRHNRRLAVEHDRHRVDYSAVRTTGKRILD